MARAALLGLVLCAACGGGGGGTAAVTAPARLTAGPLEFAPGQDTADLVVALAETPAGGPVMLQFALELPPTVTVAASAPLLALQPLPTLRGEFVRDRYRIVCGDDQSRSARALERGDLLRVRLQVATPRQPGEFTVGIGELLAAQNDGTPAAAAASPVAVTVAIR